MPYLTTRDGVSLYFKSWGTGRPIVLIHGWPLSADSWDDVALPLANAGYQTIAYDRRGFGRSDQPWEGYDYDSLADDLADVIKHHAVVDVSLVGFSMGGGEVARYMSRYSDKLVRSVALVSSVVPCMLKTNDNPHGVPQETFDEMTRGMTADRAAFFGSFFNDFYGGGMKSSSVSGNSKLVALIFSRFEARSSGAGIHGWSSPDSAQAVFACGVGGRFRLLSVAELHSGVAASRRGSWGGPESPSTEDVCLRCWLNSDSPDGDGGARHWGCCHRTLVSARARDETRRRTADNFGVSIPKGEQGLRRMLHCGF